MIVLASDDLTVTVHPEHGFVIGSIVDHSTRQNLLWNPPDARFRTLGDRLGKPGEGSVNRFDRKLLVGGWFPMIPNAGLPGGRPELWMHGEAARLSWEVIGGGPAQCTAAVLLPSSNLFVERTVTVLGSRIRTQTVVSNNGHRSVLFAPGEHPCFSRSAFQGGRIVVTEGAQAWATAPAQPSAASFAEGDRFSWPDARLVTGGTGDAGAVPREPDGHHDHLVVESGSGRVRLERPGGDRSITMSFDPELFPWLLVWSHYLPPHSPWRGDVFAVEPTAVPGRSFDDADSAREHTLLPESQAFWWMDLEVDPR